MRHFFLVLVGLIFLGMSTLVQAAEAGPEDIAAKTASGDEVILHPNGYWEYLDTKKAAAATIKVEKIARDEGCPRGTRPNFFGLGRCIANDDPVLKRGSLSGKGW